MGSGHIPGPEGPQQQCRDGESHLGKANGPVQPAHIPVSERRGRALEGFPVLVRS